MSRIVESLYQKYDLNESKQRRNSNRKLNEDSNFKDLALKKFKAACKKYNIEDPKVEFSDEGVAVYSPSFANFSYNDFHNFGKAAGIGYMEEADDDYALFDLDLGESKQNKDMKRKLNESSYSEPLFETIENALYNAGLDVTRFSDAMIMSNNLGWVVSDDDGNSVQIECLGTW